MHEKHVGVPQGEYVKLLLLASQFHYSNNGLAMLEEWRLLPTTPFRHYARCRRFGTRKLRFRQVLYREI